MQLFQSDDHPIIWRTYVEGNIQNHPEVGGYKTVCPIFIMLLSSLNTVYRRGVVLSSQI